MTSFISRPIIPKELLYEETQIYGNYIPEISNRLSIFIFGWTDRRNWRRWRFNPFAYGPGTGTFLIIAFTIFAKISIKTANAQAKVINLTSNITSLVIFLLNGEVIFSVGLVAAACNMLGGYIGAGLVMKNGAKIVKPSIILVLILLALKVFRIY